MGIVTGFERRNIASCDEVIASSGSTTQLNTHTFTIRHCKTLWSLGVASVLKYYLAESQGKVTQSTKQKKEEGCSHRCVDLAAPGLWLSRWLQQSTMRLRMYRHSLNVEKKG